MCITAMRGKEQRFDMPALQIIQTTRHAWGVQLQVPRVRSAVSVRSVASGKSNQSTQAGVHAPPAGGARGHQSRMADRKHGINRSKSKGDGE